MTSHLDHLLKKFDESLPLDRARTIPSSWYFEPEILELERQNVFAGTWQFAGRIDQLKESGRFVTCEIAGEPILIVRDEEGELRAFHNVCRHRAAQVVNLPEGSLTKLRCRYHGWTYDLKGRLRGTPEFAGVEEFCKQEEGLCPVEVAIWGPLVFVHQDRPTSPLADYLKPLPEKTASWKLEQLRFVRRKEYEIACNWKVYVDNFQDGGYHVNTVHPTLAGSLDYSQYRTENEGQTSVQISPIKPSADAMVRKVRSGSQAMYWWIFPNLMINLYQGIMDINVVQPLGPDRCRVLFDFYFQEGEEPEFMEQSIAIADQIQREDMEICEEVQKGLRSRSYETGRFSVKRESGDFHFHRLLARYLRS